MSATDPAPLVCPQCGGTNTSVGGSGSGMCFECAHMWDPAVEVHTAVAPLEPFGMASVEDVYDASAAESDADLADYRQEYIGGMATLEGGQVAQVVTFTDDERVVVTFASGDTGVVPLSDVERIVPPAPPAPDVLEYVADDEPPPEMQAVILMASQIIDAGIRAAFVAEHPDSLLDVPTGYLPADPDLWPIVEKACAVAIGMVIDGTDDTPTSVAAWFGIDLDTDTGDQQQEDSTHGEGSSETSE